PAAASARAAAPSAPSARSVLSSSNSPKPCAASSSGALAIPSSRKRTRRSASRQTKEDAASSAPASSRSRPPEVTLGRSRVRGRLRARGDRARIDDGPQVRLDLVAQMLVVGRQRELFAEALERLIDGEAGAERRDLKQDAARLAEVDRPEV